MAVRCIRVARLTPVALHRHIITTEIHNHSCIVYHVSCIMHRHARMHIVMTTRYMYIPGKIYPGNKFCVVTAKLVNYASSSVISHQSVVRRQSSVVR